MGQGAMEVGVSTGDFWVRVAQSGLGRGSEGWSWEDSIGRLQFS